jgi:hypothetical protein
VATSKDYVTKSCCSAMGLTATGGSQLISRRYSEIQRAFGLFNGPAWYTMSIDHRGPDVAMAEKSLDSADVVVGLQEMSGEAVAEGYEK